LYLIKLISPKLNQLKTVILLTVLLFSTPFCVGQTFDWKWAKGATVPVLSSGTSKTNAICHSKDSNYVYFGGQASGQSLAVVGPVLSILVGNGQDAFLAKYTSAGNLTWIITFGSGGTEEISAIDEDLLGNIIVGGSYTAATTIEGKDGVIFNLPAPSGGGTSDVFVIKLNHLGYVQWVQTGRSSGNDYIHDIEVYNNNIYIAGEYGANFSVGPTGSPTTIANQVQSDAFAWSLLSNGSLNWIRGARSSQKDSYNAVTVMASGAYFGGYFTGSSMGFLGTAISTSGNTSVGTSEGVLVRYDLNGNYLAHGLITGVGDADVYSMTNNGTDLFYQGTLNGNGITFPGNTPFNNTNTTSYTAKCNLAFTTQWKSYSSTATSATGFGIDLIGTSLVVTSMSYSGTFSGNTSIGGTDMLLLFLDQTTGASILLESFGGSGDDEPTAISAKDINTIYVGGKFGTNCFFPPQPNLSSFSNINAFWAKYGCIGGNTVLSGDATVCKGDSTTLSVAFTGGSPYSFTYTDGTTPITISSIMSSPYTFKVAPSATKTYTIISSYSAACLNTNSGVATVTVVPQITNYGILSPTEICGSAGFSINGATPIGGGAGPYIYSWEFVNNGGSPFTPLGPPVTTEDYTTANVYTTVYQYRRSVSTSTCPTKKYSDTVTVDVAMSGNIITTGNITVCSGTPFTILAQLPTNNGNYAYMWESGPDGSLWTPAAIPNTTQNYSIPNPTSTTYYRRRASSGACGFSPSGSIIITVQQPITLNTIKVKDSIICSSTAPDSILGLAISGGNGLPTYQWMQKSLLSPTWINASGFSTGQHYVPGVLTQSTMYKRIVVAGVCASSESNFDTIIVQAPMSGNIITTPNQHICETTVPDTIFAATPTGLIAPYSYVWRKRTTSNPVWTNIPSNFNYHVPGFLTESTEYIRLVRDSVCGATTSNIYKITIDSLNANNSIIGVNELCFASPTYLDGYQPTGGDTIGFQYTWQYTNNLGSAFQNFSPGQFNEDLVINSLSTATYYRRIVSSGLCPNTLSDTVFVQIPIVGNTILSTDQFICSTVIPDTIFGSLPNAGLNNYSYLWQDSTSGNNWSNATGLTADSMDYFPGPISQTTSYRRIVIDNVCGNDTSALSVITVDIPVLLNFISGDTTICYQSQPNPIYGFATIGGYGYTWEQTSDSTNSGSWTIITGANNISFSPSVLNTTMFFRRIVDGGYCDDDTSNIVTINVATPISGNSIAADTIVCVGTDNLVFSGSTITGGLGSSNYLWQSSLDNSIFDTAAGVFDQINYTSGVIIQEAYFRRRVINNACPSQNSTSNTIVISVYQSSSASFDFEKDSLCEGENVQVPITLSGVSPYSIYLTYNGIQNTLSGITGNNYTFDFTPSVSSNLIIDSIIDINGCQTSISDTFGIRLITLPQTSLFDDESICDSSYFFDPILSAGNAELSSPSFGLLATVFPYNFTTTIFDEIEFILTETNEICFDSDTMKITFTRPIGNISAGLDQVVDQANETYLNATSLIGPEIGYWQMVGSSGNIVSPNDPHSLVQDLLTGKTYFVWTVSNGTCPEKSDTVSVLIRDLFIPSGFSPNGDGNNDVFFIRGVTFYDNIGLQVFNRWGNEVYSTKDYKNDWEGKLASGEDLPEDTYFFILELTPIEMYKGYLVLKR
jgi:gliding motility-associated-like protein